eukprot:676456-Pyramimonas_sp.AAC.1
MSIVVEKLQPAMIPTLAYVGGATTPASTRKRAERYPAMHASASDSGRPCCLRRRARSSRGMRS